MKTAARGNLDDNAGDRVRLAVSSLALTAAVAFMSWLLLARPLLRLGRRP